jgi:hypothetical protein
LQACNELWVRDGRNERRFLVVFDVFGDPTTDGDLNDPFISLGIGEVNP